MLASQRRCGHDKAAIRGAREGGDVALYLAGVAHIDQTQINPRRWGHGLDHAPLTNTEQYGWVPQLPLALTPALFA